jgi:hypothetical protein
MTWLALACALAVAGCRAGGAGGAAGGTAPANGPGGIAKVGLDLSRLDGQGLVGPADGKVALGYEFCIPAGATYADEVRSIDPSLELMPGSRGRLGCGPGEVLCVGSTHQPDWRGVLGRLAALAYIDSIAPFHGE